MEEMDRTHLVSTQRMSEQPTPARSRRPTIVANPGDDRAFAEGIEQALRSARRGPTELEAALRSTYPDVVVRQREISGESFEVWYVYRDGHWVAKGDDSGT